MDKKNKNTKAPENTGKTIRSGLFKSSVGSSTPKYRRQENYQYS